MNWYQTILISVGVYALLTYFLIKIHDSMKKDEDDWAIVSYVSFCLEEYSMLFEEIVFDIHDIENPDSELYLYPEAIWIKFNRLLYLSFKLKEEGESIYCTTFLTEKFYLMFNECKKILCEHNYLSADEFKREIYKNESYMIFKKENQGLIQEINKKINEIKEKHKIVFR